MAIKRYLREEEEEEVAKKRARTEDRLSNIPEDLKLRILSSLDFKHAGQTSTLSKSWVPLWTWHPVLDFDFMTYGQYPDFEDFVNNVLRLRDQTAKLQRLSLTGFGKWEVKFITEFLDYALQHSVENLEIEINEIHDYDTWPVYLNASCESSLKSLKLQSVKEMSFPFLGPISGLKNLRVLHLQNALITVREPLIGFPLLESLTLVDCNISTVGETLGIIARNLFNFTIFDCPSLKCCELATPNLRFFEYRGSNFPQLRTYGGLPVLDTITFDFHHYGNMQEKRNFDDLLSLFYSLRTVKSIRLLPCVIDLLYFFQDELVNRSSPFQNLESSVLYFNGDPETFMIDKLKAFLLQNSPDAKVYKDKEYSVSNCGVRFLG